MASRNIHFLPFREAMEQPNPKPLGGITLGLERPGPRRLATVVLGLRALEPKTPSPRGDQAAKARTEAARSPGLLASWSRAAGP